MPLPEEIKDWITINGAHIPVDSEGELQGEAGREIAGAKARKAPPDTTNVRRVGGLTYARALEDYIVEAGGNRLRGTHEFFKNELQGKSVTCQTDSGEQQAWLLGATWRELRRDMNRSPLKAELIPLIPDIVATGEYTRRDVYKQRADGAARFHEYKKRVKTNDGEERAVIVDVRERPSLREKFSVYSLTGKGVPGYEKRDSYDKKESASRMDSCQITRMRETLSKDSITKVLEIVNIRFKDEPSPADEGAESMNQQRRARDALALDSGAPSARSIDANGYMHVAASHITKEQIVPYWGREVPGWQEHGLIPDKLYYAYRDPEELAKSVATWNGLPLHVDHHIDSSNDPQKMARVGAMGTNACWNPPYIDNSLIIWDADAQRGVKDGSFREISCAYRYTPDFTPGEKDGIRYDFVMRDIEGNHVALVEDGRAGKDVVVADKNTIGGDSMAKEIQSSPATVDEMIKKLLELKAKNADNEKAALDEFLGSMGQKEEGTGLDDDLPVQPEADEKPVEDDDGVIDPRDGGDDSDADVDEDDPDAGPDTAEDEDADAEEDDEDAPAEDEDDEEGAKMDAFVKALTPEQMTKLAAKLAEAIKTPPARDCDDKNKPAMDYNSIKNKLTREFQRRYNAVRAVRPYCGDLNPMAFDSAAAIYGQALRAMGINTRGYKPGNFRAMFDAAVSQRNRRGAVAMDKNPVTLTGAFAGMSKILIGE